MARLATVAAPLLLSLAALTASAQEPTTFVIVHGAWGGSWDWRTVDSLLTSQGHRVYRPDLTGLGKRSHLASEAIRLDTHIADVVNEILWEELTDVVLVGHSYGGMVVSGVADSIPGRIRELVYVDAFLPRDGESVLGLLDEEFRTMIATNVRNGLVPAPWVQESAPIPRDVPHPFRTFTDVIELGSRFEGVPGRYILTTEPTEQPDGFQPYADRAAERGWEVVTMQAGHTPERSHPAELVALLVGRR